MLVQKQDQNYSIYIYQLNEQIGTWEEFKEITVWNLKENDLQLANYPWPKYWSFGDIISIV